MPPECFECKFNSEERFVECPKCKKLICSKFNNRKCNVGSEGK